MTSPFAIKNLKEAERSTSAPPGLEARLAAAISTPSSSGSVRTPFGHSHAEQEEAHVVVAGSGTCEGEDEETAEGFWTD